MLTNIVTILLTNGTLLYSFTNISNIVYHAATLFYFWIFCLFVLFLLNLQMCNLLSPLSCLPSPFVINQSSVVMKSALSHSPLVLSSCPIPCWFDMPSVPQTAKMSLAIGRPCRKSNLMFPNMPDVCASHSNVQLHSTRRYTYLIGSVSHPNVIWDDWKLFDLEVYSLKLSALWDHQGNSIASFREGGEKVGFQPKIISDLNVSKETHGIGWADWEPNFIGKCNFLMAFPYCAA